ncbi:YwqG family protein [Streptacidiphilus sp. N1-10]|uniref:YwqG family protein n=1 Tax=Streptacidiphilus jeojiensis TaxID=3229225 RepID=A0ABV6Y1C9_9ACTN
MPSGIISAVTTSLRAYEALAAEHLPTDAAAQWTALLRPCVRLLKASGAEPTAAQLGGEPLLPADTTWPEWPDHGPLSFIASIDCAVLPRDGVDPAFPESGTLLFFFDGQIDDGDAMVWVADAETWAGARVLYVPEGTETATAATPTGLEPYPCVSLTAATRCSIPDPWHPRSLATLTDGNAPLDPRAIPPHVKAFMDALCNGNTTIGHQVGGHACPVQGPVEYEIAHAILGPKTRWTDPRLDEEAQRWVLLAQIDTDADAKMMWGDCGTLYWLIRPEDLAARRFEEAKLTWQCC